MQQLQQHHQSTGHNRLLYSVVAKHAFFSYLHGTLTKIDHILSHKINLNKFKRMENIQCLLSGHTGIKLERSRNRTINEKFPNTWRLNYTLLK